MGRLRDGSSDMPIVRNHPRNQEGQKAWAETMVPILRG